MESPIDQIIDKIRPVAGLTYSQAKDLAYKILSLFPTQLTEEEVERIISQCASEVTLSNDVVMVERKILAKALATPTFSGEKECACVYEGEPHGIEFINMPSGKPFAIGGTNTKDRFKFCPWCGGKIKKPTDS
jgi:hypothetical protein